MRLASLPEVHKIHIENGKCVIKMEAEPLPTLPPTEQETQAPSEEPSTAPPETTTPARTTEEEKESPPAAAAAPEIGVSAEVTVD
mmetsp:Transcript_4465/g.3644  ORF Transcript_4465/g.3644 Transcript_4465/m.3644 type:complete len:85 (+) Transcript_4465:3-257(+)